LSFLGESVLEETSTVLVSSKIIPTRRRLISPSGHFRVSREGGVSANHVHGFGRFNLQNDGRATMAKHSLTPMGS
jgi:hypothetical protein